MNPFLNPKKDIFNSGAKPSKTKGFDFFKPKPANTTNISPSLKPYSPQPVLHPEEPKTEIKKEKAAENPELPKEKKDVSARVFKHFFRHMLKAHSELSKKRIAKKHIEERFKEIKPEDNKLRKKLNHIEKELKQLIDEDKIILKTQKQDEELIKRMENKIEKFDFANVKIKPFEDFEKISVKLDDNKKNISEINRKVENISRELSKERAEELEKKIDERLKTRHDIISEIEKRLTLLEARHKRLKRSKKHTKKDLDRIEKIIKEHKNKLEIIKKGL